MSLYSLYSILFLTFTAVFIIFFYLFRAAKILLFFDTFVLFRFRFFSGWQIVRGSVARDDAVTCRQRAFSNAYNL